MKIQKLTEKLSHLTDPRRTRYGNIRHKLEDIIVIGLCTVICGGEDFADMRNLAENVENFYGIFLNFRMAYPTVIRSGEYLKRFILKNYLNVLSIGWKRNFRTDVIAIDGKTIRGSADKAT